MQLSDLRQEVQSRGFDYLPASRINTWLNWAYHDVCHRQAWPFLETTTSGVAPITISDFGHALSVVDTTGNGPLSWEDVRTLREQDPTLTGTGSPMVWYMDGSALTVYPASTTNTISVRYLKVPTDLSADSDTPLIPSRFHYILVEGALVKAYKDDDETASAQDAATEFEAGIMKMTNELLVPNFDTPASFSPSFYSTSSDW